MSAVPSELSSTRVRGKAPESRRPMWRDLSILLFLTLVTRVPFLGIAEPDSALFATGVRQWLRGGPTNLSIYSAQVCALYYASVAALMRGLHLGEQNCVLVMSVLSVIACFGIVVFGYLIGARLAGPQAALGGMLLFTLSPGLWWTTMEPHPQSASLCFGMAALWSFYCYLERRTLILLLGAITGLAFAIAIKNDAILLVPALLALALWVRASWRSIAMAAFVAGSAAGFSMVLARLAFGWNAHPLSGSRQALGRFARLPGLLDLVRDSAPIVFGIGALTAIVLALVLAYALTKDSDRRRWWMFLACWCLPGYIFWLCIAGNDVRHVIIFGLPLFWLSAKYLRLRYISTCLILSLLVPPNSNMFMFPSPNVPGSALLFAKKKVEIGAVADQLAVQQSCFMGSYTNDYIVNALLDRGGHVDSQLSELDVSSRAVTMPNRAVVTFDRISTSSKMVNAGSCRSLEHNEAGRKVRFLGGEWHIPIV